MNRVICFRILATAGLAALAAVPQDAADVRHLTLTEAVHLAISQNRALKIARLKVVENEQKKAGERSALFSGDYESIERAAHHRPAEDRDSGGALGTVAGSLIPAQGIARPAGPADASTPAARRSPSR